MVEKLMKNPKIKPVSNPDLKKCIDDLKLGSNSEKQLNFIKSLEKAQLLAPTKFEVELTKKNNEVVPSVKSDQVHFYLINTNDEKTFFPAFTDLEMAGQFQLTQSADEVPQMVVQTIGQYDRLLSDSKTKAIGIIINPGVDNMVVPSELVRQLVRPMPPQEVQVHISEPTVYPTQLVNEMYDWAKAHPSIQKVWLKQKLEGARLSFLFILEDQQQDRQLLTDFCYQAAEFAKKVNVEAVFKEEQMNPSILKDSVPFFDRELGL